MKAIKVTYRKKKATQRLAEFQELRAAGCLSADKTERFASQAANLFLSHHHADEGYLADAITLLCEIATLEDKVLAEPGARGLFSFLVERLSDSFDPRYCALYDRLFTQVVTFCRHLPEGQALDHALTRFGLLTQEDLLRRKERLKRPPPFASEGRNAVRKVLIPSRVTLGADIAVTSVVMATAKRLFPDAEIVLLALPQTGQLFAGDPRVRIHPVAYDRGGGLIARLNAWLDVLQAVDEEIASLPPETYLVLDPDSRLTQLGIFPLVDDETRYRFFESRGYQVAGIEGISQLTAAWLAECFGGDVAEQPYLCLREADVALGGRIGQRLRQGDAAHIVMVNWGVGGNDRKRVGDAFEAELVLRLIAEGSAVILAKGVGQIEIERANRLAGAVQAQGGRVVEVANGNGEGPLPADLLAWQGQVGAFCGLIAASDLYLGYDSAGQHIAAALGVPTIDLFVDRSYPLIARRWRPYGPGLVRVIEAKIDVQAMDAKAQQSLLDEILTCYRQIREAARS